MSPLEQAAIDYVAARVRNDAAEPSDWCLRAGELAGAWQTLVDLSGLSVCPVNEPTQKADA